MRRERGKDPAVVLIADDDQTMRLLIRGALEHDRNPDVRKQNPDSARRRAGDRYRDKTISTGRHFQNWKWRLGRRDPQRRNHSHQQIAGALGSGKCFSDERI